MDDVPGALTFTGIAVAEFLATIAAPKRNPSTSETDDPHRVARVTGNEHLAGSETNRSIQSATALGGR